MTSTPPSHTSESATASQTGQRIAGISGIAFVVLLVASMVIVGDMPVAGDGAGELKAYFQDNLGRHQFGILVIGAALLPAIIFFAGLASRQRSAEGDHVAPWAAAISVSAATALALLGMGVVVDAGLLLSRGAEVADGTLVALWNVSIASTGLMVLAFGCAALSVAVPILGRKTGPAWYGWLGVLVAILSVVALPTIVSVSDTATTLAMPVLPAFVIWIIVSSVQLIRD